MLHDQTLLGVLTAELVEAADRPTDLGAANVQRLVQTTLSAYEQTAPSPELASAFERLRSRFAQVPSDDERTSELQELALERNEYLARLPEPSRAANNFGALVQQISYNAQTVRNAAADKVLRAQLAGSCTGPIPSTYVSTCMRLAQLTPRDLDEVYRSARQIVEQAAADTAHDQGK